MILLIHHYTLPCLNDQCLVYNSIGLVKKTNSAYPKSNTNFKKEFCIKDKVTDIHLSIIYFLPKIKHIVAELLAYERRNQCCFTYII